MKIADFFKKKITSIFLKSTEINLKPIEYKQFDVGEFDVEHFNYWFCELYDGYDGRKGCKGIFLRTDKLSPSMMQDYLDYFGYEPSHENVWLIEPIIRKDWIDKLSKI